MREMRGRGLEGGEGWDAEGKRMRRAKGEGVVCEDRWFEDGVKARGVQEREREKRTVHEERVHEKSESGRKVL